jgi:predicted aspartyl protease/Flp pilus assembly protein TadD
MKILFLVVIVSLLFYPILAESRGSLKKKAEREIRAGNFDNAEKIYRDLLGLNLDDKEARLGLSFVLLKQNKFTDCFEEASQVIAVDPLNARAFSLMGTALLRSGDFRTSVESFLTSLKLNERDHLALAGIAEVSFYEHRTRISYEYMKRALSIESRESDYFVTLARICSRLEQYTEAADAYQSYLSVSPKTDEERRARILGLISFYRYLGTTKLNRPSGPEVVTIPFEIHGNRPFIKIRINNKEELNFVIDTGASLSVISDKAAEKLGIKAVAKGGSARAVGGNGSFAIIYGVIDSMTIGAAKIDLVPTYIRTVHSADDTPAAQRADGYIGLSVLSNYGATLDYKEKVIILDRTPLKEDSVSTAPPIPTDDVAVPLRTTSGGLASAESMIEGHDKPLNFIVDTGASTTVISKAAVKKHNLENLKLKNASFRVIGAAGVEDDVEAVGLSTLTVNGLRQKNARALILNLDPVNETSGFEQHGILGGDFLRNFKVQIDMRKFSFTLTPQTKSIEKIAAGN